MALIEEQIVITRKDADGNLRMQFPVTHKDYVEGLAEIEEAASKGGVPVGHIYFSLEKTVPTGSLPLNGGTYAHLAYIDLWNYILEKGNYLTFDEWQAMYDANDGNVPFYAITRSGSQSQWRFRVPSINGWVKGASSLEEVGSYLEAGVPNIEGMYSASELTEKESDVYATGAFYDAGKHPTTNYNAGGDKNGAPAMIGFDASLANTIYGNSDTVQPPSIVGMWLVKAFGTVSNVGNQDIADISAGLTRVENQMTKYTDEVAYIDSFIVETWKSDDGLSWYRRYSDGWIEQGGTTPNATSGTITFPKSFTSDPLSIMLTEKTGNIGNSKTQYALSNISATKFTWQMNDKTISYWHACGF